MAAERRTDTISRRRELLEEVLVERSKVVAGLPIDAQEPGPGSRLWPAGAIRLVPFVGGPLARRRAVLDLAVLALAWLEAFDQDADG